MILEKGLAPPGGAFFRAKKRRSGTAFSFCKEPARLNLVPIRPM